VDCLRGMIRVALPVAFGTREVIPREPAFMHRQPLLRMELRVSDLYQDFVAEGVEANFVRQDHIGGRKSVEGALR